MDGEMDERMEMEKNEKKRKITELAESYGYAYDDVKQVGSSAIFDWEIRKEKQADKGIPIGNHKQMADFIRFLRSCRGSKLKILGTITNPYAGQVKGTGVDFTLSDEHTLYFLHLYMNTVLYDSQDGFYQYWFDWEDKEYFWEDRGIFQPYTDEELDKIIAYENYSDAKNNAIKGNGRIGKKCWHWYSKLKEKKSFGGGKQKEYSFIYDLVVLEELTNYIGDGFSGTIGKEKYDKVKNWISAYEKQTKRWYNAHRKEREEEIAIFKERWKQVCNDYKKETEGDKDQ